MTEIDPALPEVARPRRFGFTTWRASTPFARIAAASILIGLAVTFGFAVFLRIWHIDRLGFNSDEAVYAGQGGSIAGDGSLEPFFPIFRAHPLLYQTVLSLGFLAGGGDGFGRLLSAAVGLATIAVTYSLGSVLYGKRAGVIAAVFIALMPYHVLVSRQVLLDLPEALFATLTAVLLAKFARTASPLWLYAAGGALGLTFLSKEVGILFVGAAFAFLALSPEIRIRARDIAISLGVLFLVVLPYPLSLAFAGKAHTGSAFFSYQLFRRPNHSLLFYPTSVAGAIGPLLLLAAAAGLLLLWRERSWRETLLLSWVIVPAMFFEVWPVKGFQYLLPLAPPLAVLAARTFARLLQTDAPASPAAWHRPVALLGVAVVSLSLAVPAWDRINPSQSGKFLAGSGGIPGGREAGRWVRTHVPVGATVLAIGPSMANILEFYGHRQVFGLSVSPNPLRRNPVYESVANPDLMIRHNDIQYVVWDSYSASRSSFFGNKLLGYARRYNGRVLHQETIDVRRSAGRTVTKPVIVIYAVRP